MKKRLIIFILTFLNFPFSSSARIPNTEIYNQIEEKKYFRFNYENDFFTATDQYYTQGFSFELTGAWSKKLFLSKLLLHYKTEDVQYGISLEHNAYTPSSIRHNGILYGDHPFAACIMLNTFSNSYDSVSDSRLSTVFTIGGIGPVAFGEEMQKSIHKWLNNIEPLGWQNQINNDVLINYEFNYNKRIFDIKNYLALDSKLELNVGTLKDDAKVGFTISGGFNNPLTSMDRKSNAKFKMYVYYQPQISLVGYDATLQGGMFNHSSTYVLHADEIIRIVMENRAGVVLRFGNMFLNYSQAFITKEFKSGSNHRWGGISIGINF